MIVLPAPPVLNHDLAIALLAAPTGLKATGRVHVAVLGLWRPLADRVGDRVGDGHAHGHQRLALDVDLALPAVVAVVAVAAAVAAVSPAVAAVGGLGALGRFVRRLLAARL